jgi:type IV fimbrial biogenesis protein FimT
MQKSLGLTLFELRVALAIVGVMTGLALPAFQGFVERSRATAALNSMLGAIQSARYAAVMLRAPSRCAPLPATPQAAHATQGTSAH